MATEPSSKRFSRWQRVKGQKIGGFVSEVIATVARYWKGEHFASLKISAPRLVLFCVVLIALFFAMTPPSLLVPVPFVVGQTFPYDIRAHRTVRYLSEIATKKRKQAVAQAIPRQYRLDPSDRKSVV